ncbi:SRPBCC family protein [Cytobacillus purgationiresistens]|uniref:Uncharacterized protein YndB with AHSA1/START domain n=1 Tax=Cytobacillus purgationiresistens TaxID=863449 RepID=A0ABU0AJG2_9BACI|nr:SRPBCC domain-containing protein [Cytobacillus purgationiresistens]MDQ0271403.1 uncharacterized protein YndB with AHSA1/START domain [Cytobacillus purgationiresistens]
MKKSFNETLSRVEGRDLIIERVFNAPRELVFKAFSDSTHLANWWGPKGWTTTNYRMELFPEGVWHYCMRSTDGHESWGKSTYKEIVEPERIVYIDAFSDKDENTIANMPEMMITLSFKEYDGKTNLICRTQFESEDELNKIMEMGVVAGLTESWDCLEIHLEAAKED